MTKKASPPPQQSLSDAFIEGFNSTSYLTADTRSTSPENEHTEGNGESKLNPRSCVTCRRRKVRCDKHEPCSNCTKAKVDCIFPPPGRAPRKPRRPQDAELLKRLRRLESVVDSLGNQPDDDADFNHVGTTIRRHGDISERSPGSRQNSVEHGLGRLVIKEGRSRYVNNDFWSTLGEEIAEIRFVLDEPSSEEDEQEASPISAKDTKDVPVAHQGWVFGYSSLVYDMSKVHPSPSQIFIIWEIFKENVDPVLKVFHVPTVKNVIMKASVSAASLSRPNEAVFYSICFASVVSMSEDQCQHLLDEPKLELMRKYRFAVEQGLSRAGFLNSSSLMVLQAFTMYLMVVKYMDSSRSIWSLAGLAMQQAQAQGLHRDGTNFKLSPFDVEMRRRLWWHIALLDSRASEDYGADPTDRYFDTKMPRNVNDEDIWPNMQDEPKEQIGASEMTFCLMRFELGNTQRRLRLNFNNASPSEMGRTVEDQEKLIDATHQHLEEKFFIHCNPSVPFLWVTATVGRLILAKMWLMVHHPRLVNNNSAEGELRDKIFTTSVEVIEFGYLLEQNTNTAKWSWLFRTYMQWHAVAYVLSELCNRDASPSTERAWRAIETVYDRVYIEQMKSQRSVLWKPIKQLYARANAHRDQLNGLSPQSGQSTANSETLSPGKSISDINGVGMPFGNVTNSFGLDFSDVNTAMMIDATHAMPSLNSMNDVQLNDSDLQWTGWTPEVGDFNLATQMPQQNWGSVMQQEWF